MYSGITVGAITTIGQKHVRRETPCEDASLAVQRDGVSVVCIADGAGSKQYTHARFGSKSAVETISGLLIDHFDAIYAENREQAARSLIIASLHVAFAKLMDEHDLSTLDQLSCTLLFCAVKDRRMLIGHLGDGLIARITPSGVSPFTMPQNEKDGTTFFVTAGHAPDYLRLIKTTTDDTHAVCLMTDGVQDSVYDENSGLVKPVVVKLAETFSKGREEGEASVLETVEKYIVGASNTSDDASFGVMYFEGTDAPDTGKLEGTASPFKTSDETFKTLQKSMVDDVKAAHRTIAEHAGKELPEEPAKPVKTEAPEEEKTDRTPAPEQEQAVSDENKFNKSTLIAGIEAAVIVILILLLIFK